MFKTEHYRVKPGKKASLTDWPSDGHASLDKDRAAEEFASWHERFIQLTELLYAERKHALLVVLQGMDTSGKDSATRAVFGGVSPTGVDATSFKAPTDAELSHDFLWRVHAHTPGRGEIAIWNRSHYEDVLIVRVKELAPKKRWQARYDHINAFEKLLADEGVIILKFYLHISKDFQKERLQKRLDDAEKHWKFNPGDLAERARWNDYMAAYEDALQRCSTQYAPWYVIPAEKRWFRDLLITRILVERLEALKMTNPSVDFDPKKIKIR